MGPINYAAQFNDPSGAAMAGYATGLNFQGANQTLRMNDAAEARARELHPLAMEGQRLGMDMQVQANDRANDANSRAQGQFEQQQAAAGQDAQRQQQFRADMGRLASKGAGATFEDYQKVAGDYPEYAAAIRETWDALDDNRKDGMSEVMGQVALAFQGDNADRAVEILTQYADAAENSGDLEGAATARGLAKLPPEAALASIGVALTDVNPDLAQSVFGSSESKVQSSQMIGGLVSVQTMNDGSTRVVDATTNEPLEGQAAMDAIKSAQVSVGEAERIKTLGRGTGENEADIDSGGQANAAEALGSAQATFVTDALNSSSQVRSSMRTIDEAIAAIDGGAQAGIIYNRMPRLSEEGAALQNAMDRMGLDVVGSVTFGALSEGELRLAMSTAVPRNLSAPQLRSWLVEKRDAQAKVLTALSEQAEFLSDPKNTLQMWTQRVGNNQEQSPPPNGQTPSYMEFAD